jgi:hypothetical protein
MNEPTLSVVVEGLADEGGRVRLSDLLQELQLVTRAMRRVDVEVSGEPTGSFYYRIQAVSYASPLTIVLEPQLYKPTVDVRAKVADRFFSIVSSVAEGDIPKRVDTSLLADIKQMTAPVGESLLSARIIYNGRTLSLDKNLGAQVDVALAPEETWTGEMRGMLEYINIHEGKNVFRIYPEIGPPHLSCNFPPELRDEAILAVGRYVNVQGLFKYKAVSDFPHEVDVKAMEVFPVESKLPTLMDLRGIAPKATGKLSSGEFVRRLRDGREEA